MSSTDPREGIDPNDIAALEEAGYGVEDLGTGNKTMTPADVSKITGDSSSRAAEAGHVARDDMAAAGDMGVPENRHDK